LPALPEGRDLFMRRTTLLLVIMSLALLLASGVALAAKQIDCSDNPGPLCVGTPNSDEIEGTNTRDDIRAQAGDDLVKARAGNDVVNAGEDNDLAYGQRGADRLNAGQCDNDWMVGGPGDDTINVSDECAFAFAVGMPGPESVGDKAECGPGFDVVRGVNEYDWVASDCERVVRE
jgi:hemolysin type calcium-binding protein